MFRKQSGLAISKLDHGQKVAHSIPRCHSWTFLCGIFKFSKVVSFTFSKLNHKNHQGDNFSSQFQSCPHPKEAHSWQKVIFQVKRNQEVKTAHDRLNNFSQKQKLTQ